MPAHGRLRCRENARELPDADPDLVLFEHAKDACSQGFRENLQMLVDGHGTILLSG
jgi:hypothetical protein